MQASQPDELTIEEQEILEVIDDGDMEDWVKVQEQQLYYSLYLPLGAPGPMIKCKCGCCFIAIAQLVKCICVVTDFHIFYLFSCWWFSFLMH